MSKRLEHLEPVMEELERYGLRGEIGERGKHLEIRWKTPNGERFITMPRTPSDWRSALNSRSDLRKLLRADNLQPKPISDLTFQKAMSLPKPPPSITKEQFLQNDVDALTDLVFELQSRLSEMQAAFVALDQKTSSARVVSYIQYGESAVKPEVENELIEKIERVVPHEGPFRQGSTQDKIYKVLTDQYMSIDQIKQLANVPNPKYVNTTLWKAKDKGFVECGLRGMYRRKAR